jgi:hypothetical protein
LAELLVVGVLLLRCCVPKVLVVLVDGLHESVLPLQQQGLAPGGGGDQQAATAGGTGHPRRTVHELALQKPKQLQLGLRSFALGTLQTGCYE